MRLTWQMHNHKNVGGHENKNLRHTTPRLRITPIKSTLCIQSAANQHAVAIICLTVPQHPTVPITAAHDWCNHDVVQKISVLTISLPQDSNQCHANGQLHDQLYNNGVSSRCPMSHSSVSGPSHACQLQRILLLPAVRRRRGTYSLYKVLSEAKSALARKFAAVEPVAEK